MSAPAAVPRLRLRVTATAETIIRGGHPWVYSASLREQNRNAVAGELAVIYDRQDKFLALGFFDPDSPIRVRILHAGKPVTLDTAWWRARLTTAVAKRTPETIGPDTDGYRLINGESDGWPGLVLDRYAGTLVLKLYSAAWLPRLGEISTLIREALSPEHLILRLSRNIQDLAREQGWVDGCEITVAGRPDQATVPTVIFRESGLSFEAEVVQGQKTGFFLDQRDNRRLVETLTQGGDVLNAFSFSGGFSLYAARGGAKSVTDLDISLHALESAKRNFALNQSVPGIAAATHEQIQGDAFQWLATGPERSFDCIVLDPPSLAKRETERASAIQAYARLAASGVGRVRPGGVLLAASCSAHVSAEEFFGAVRSAARSSGRRFTELRTTGHAPDHPATFPEANYLKAIYLRFG